MPVSFVKPQPNPATQERLAEVGQTLAAMARALAPATKAAERAIRQLADLAAATRQP
ncbi:hypothetical protein [Streptomyces sp. NPDC012888]|uniref:hypothetical protein n=1 Tax=Streptomyces sp. NPDC012888 TaxID=3364855 RepID=UPI0036B5D40C